MTASAGMMPSIADSRFQAEADEATLNDIVSGGSGHSSRQPSRQPSPHASQPAPVKVLTRPVSSGQDPATGFSFTKAMPIQPFDFRRPKQIQSPPLLNTAQAVQNGINGTDDQGPSSRHMLKDPFSVPFPRVIPAQSHPYNHSSSNTTNGAIRMNGSSSAIPSNEVTMSADDIPADSVQYESQALSTAPAPNHSSSYMAGVVGGQPVNMPHRSNKTSRNFLTSVAGSPKITKSRRKKPKTVPATAGSNHKDTYTEEDIFRLWMYRRSQGQQEREYLRATQHEMEVKIRKLHDTSNDLFDQLQESVQRETQSTAELAKLKSNKPIWESKIKRLSDYVKGLGNDLKKQREDAEDKYKEFQDVLNTKKQLHNTLEDAQESLKQERVRFQRRDDDASHTIENLTQAVQHQNAQLQSDDNLIMVERERNSRLEEQLSTIATNNGQLIEVLTGHRDSIANKLDELLHQAQSIVPRNESSESNSVEPIMPMLEQCVGILQELHKTAHVKPEDIQKLNDNMNIFVEGIAHSVEACEETSISIEAEQKQLALTVQDQLRAFGSEISSGQALSEQISDLREVKATVRERLQATETSLIDARNEILALRLKDQEQSRSIVTLETIAAKAQIQPAEDPQTLLRFQELASRNSNLESEIVTARKEAADTFSQFQQSSTEVREATERLAAIQNQVEAANRETLRLQEEKAANERQSITEREQLRIELSRAAYTHLASMKFDNVQQARLEESLAEEKLQNATKQLNILKVEKAKSEKEVGNLQGLLKEAQSKKEAVDGSVQALKLHVKEMEVRLRDTNGEYRDLQAILNKANDQVKVKEAEVIALRASQATRPSSSRVSEHRSSVRGTQSTQSGQALHRPLQHASINQNPPIQTADRTSSKHFTNGPAVVKDSQPTDKPKFVSLDDLMLEDPFAGYAQAGSQSIASEDMSHLFPSTPGPSSRVRDVDHSQSSVFQTTVVSKMQRKHQSLREATPHTGAHGMSKTHSQSQLRTHSNAMAKPSAATSPINIISRGHHANTPHSQREASITRESTQPQGSVKDPRKGKRNVVAAGFIDTDSQARPSKVQHSGYPKQPKNLGPVIEDSQSPLLNGRLRKIPRRKSSAPKEDKYTRRFAQG